MWKEMADIPPVMPSTPAIETAMLESILVLSFTTAIILVLLPHECISGNPVPTIIFKGLPSTFHTFVISVIFAFSGAFTALMIQNKPKISRFCRYYSMAGMASAAVSLFWALSLGQGQLSLFGI
ncbi:hypothetical protein L1049_021715 [Liquidambar formosana]|uniref:Uncharacterized protein n=1 Tax=Liquidambar formosana TaxID=63359 RepID=A0AAP0RBA9_LIQFO